MEQDLTASEKIEPLKDVPSFLNWSSDSRRLDKQSRCSTLLSKAATSQDQRFLVCHDLQGGYGDDSLLHGGNDATQFTLHSWHLIDIFVYFSHNLITIPPPSWTEAAHRHGVQVLGTFITEWKDGKANCEELFSSIASAEKAAQQLVKIASYFHFEGWLINIENELREDALPKLLHFLRELHRLMHKSTDRALVIWYDAVTSEGRLQWQNNLTDLNRKFFDACDALFVNYTWKAETPARAAIAAGERAQDVFMGVDVFGRNTFGGGGMQSHVAVDAAFSAGLSCALFAPGWVWETAHPRSEWRKNSNQMWGLISSIDARHRSLRSVVTSLPFVSAFNRGCGPSVYYQGVLLSTEPWYDLSKQDIQPISQETFLLKILISIDESRRQAVSVRLTWLHADVQDLPACNGSQVLCIKASLEPFRGMAGSICKKGSRQSSATLALHLGSQEKTTISGGAKGPQLAVASHSMWRCWQNLDAESASNGHELVKKAMLRGQDLEDPMSNTKDDVAEYPTTSRSEESMETGESWVKAEGVFFNLEGAVVNGIGLQCSTMDLDGRFYAEIGEVSLQYRDHF